MRLLNLMVNKKYMYLKINLHIFIISKLKIIFYMNVNLIIMMII